MKTALVALNVSYIHKNLALRWLWITKPAHHEAQIFEGLTKQPLALIDNILAFQPDVVALSVYIFNLDASLVLIRELKQRCPQIIVVAGGPEATYHPEPLFDAGIDRIYRGEAELVFWDDLEGNSVGGVQHHPADQADVLRADLSVLETLESPYFLDIDAHDMDKRYLYVESSRGCPFGCTYCLAALDPKVRTFSESYMSHFFDQVAQTTTRQIKFLDRTFNLDPHRALRLAHRCLDLPKALTVHVELVGDRLSEELITLFESHPERFRLELGVQSLNPDTLKAVGRVSHLPKLLDVVDRFAQADLIQHTDLIAGLPQEDLTSFRASYNGLIQRKPHEVQVGILKVLHGSALQGLRLSPEYVVDDQAPYVVRQTPWMSKADLESVEAVALATERVYNSQKMRDELLRVFAAHDPYGVMESMGRMLQKLVHPYTNQDFYTAIYSGLYEHLPQSQAQALVQHAYYRQSKMLPPKLFDESLDKTTLNALRSAINADSSVKHLAVSQRIDGQSGWLIWCYGSTPQVPSPIVLTTWPTLEKDSQ